MVAVAIAPVFTNAFGTSVVWSSVGTALPAGVALDVATGAVTGDTDEYAEGCVLKVTDGIHSAFTNPFTIGVLSLVAGAVFLADPNDPATVTLSGGDVSIVTDQLGGTVVRLATSGSGVLPDLAADVASGRDVINFFDDIDGSPAADAIYFQRSASINTTIASTFGSLTAKTAYLAVRLSAVRASTLANAHTSDTIFAYVVAGTPYWSLHARQESGVYSAVLINAGVRVDSGPLTLDTWHIIAVRHGGGFIDIKVDDGAWSTPVASGDTVGETSGGFGYNSQTGKGFNGDIGQFLTYGTKHTDLEAAQNYTVLRALFPL